MVEEFVNRFDGEYNGFQITEKLTAESGKFKTRNYYPQKIFVQDEAFEEKTSKS